MIGYLTKNHIHFGTKPERKEKILEEYLIVLVQILLSSRKNLTGPKNFKNFVTQHLSFCYENNMFLD